MNITTAGIIIQGLLPKVELLPTVKIQDLLYPVVKDTDPISILTYKVQLNGLYSPSGKINSIDYREFIQRGNSQIKALVSRIVSPTDSSDEKAEKILRWVRENITYVSDDENYGLLERWAYPTETMTRRTGDCEDGAFLLHSMLLAAGVPYNRIKTYAGLVEDGYTLGGHAWTIYKRESDNQWVDLDWCYFPEDVSMEDRETLKNQGEYVDAYWWMDAMGTYDESFKWGINIYS